MNILVTGAAGYIGSILTQELIKEGNSVIALDNLEQGHREAVTPEALFIQADIGDSERLGQVFRNHFGVHTSLEVVKIYGMFNRDY